MKSNYYQGKSVLITGGSSGIGFSLANALVAMDAKVILLARDYENLKIAKTAILEKYPKAKVKIVPVDVTDEKTLALLYSKYMRNHEIPDILINCAGVARPGYVQELPAHVFRWTMDIDYFGTVNMVRLLLPGVIGTFGYTAYCGAKFAVKGFSDALRSEVKPKGIRVSVLYPPDTDTPQLAWEDQYKPKETKAISGTAKPISPDLVAQQTLKDAARGKYAIVPGFEAKLMYFAGTRLGNWIYPIMDMMVRSALKKTK